MEDTMNFWLQTINFATEHIKDYSTAITKLDEKSLARQLLIQQIDFWKENLQAAQRELNALNPAA